MKVLALFLAACLLYVNINTVSTLAKEFEEHEQDRSEVRPEKYHSMIATAYCLTGSTATGTTPRAGIAASKPAWFGKTVKVYWNDGGKPGAMIGTYTVEDTGGAPIRNGSVIDIWMPTEDECFEFGRRCVLVEVVE